jgi:hypothetical protein
MSLDPFGGVLNLWKFHVNFGNPKLSTFAGPTVITPAAFTAPCLDTQDCIPQPGTAMKLDALGDRLMYRLAYRNVGDHASIVATHTVVAPGGNAAVRWYELRDPAGTPTIYQQGTFAPDSDNRWMASIGMDHAGNIGVGYSVASAATYPSIRFSGWELGDTAGELQAETFSVNGGGAQTGYNRWGDYSSIRIDPRDDCTFWYTQEYQATTQSANWNTRIVSFRFPSCTLVSSTTTLSSSPNPSTVGQSVTFTATVSPSNATGTVQFLDGTTAIGSGVVTAGVASLSTSALAAGDHDITAVYSGDGSYASSTSAIVTQVVSGGTSINTTTTLTSSRNPSNAGQAVTFTATVSPSAATGTVQFFDGSALLGSAPLSGGRAALTTSLGSGSHSITAAYSGDSTYNASTSAVLTQTVRGRK